MKNFPEMNAKKYPKILFGSYVIFLLWISFIGISILYPTRLYGNYGDVAHNLIPFGSITAYFINFNQYNFNTWFYNTFGNVLVFIPLGIFLPLVFDAIKRITQVIIFIFMCSLLIELLQYVTLLGVFDVDDIILNLIGGISGFLITIPIKKMKKKSL